MAPGLAARAGAETRPFVAYHESWLEVPATIPERTRLARLPSYIGIVALAFARPDAVYEGGLQLDRTGLQYPFGGKVLKDATALLRQRNPDTRIVLSVGGATYADWPALNEEAIARLVSDLGLDGVDIDFEPVNPGCWRRSDESFSCRHDAQLQSIVERFRARLPRPLLLTVAGWSVGAYGEGAFEKAMPKSAYTGMMLPLLRSPAARHIDLVSVMAYEAGPLFDPLEAYRAYRAEWKGRLALGFLAGTGQSAAVGGAVETLADHIRPDPLAGMMLYALSADAEQSGSREPAARPLAGAICEALSLAGCDMPVP